VTQGHSPPGEESVDDHLARLPIDPDVEEPVEPPTDAESLFREATRPARRLGPRLRRHGDVAVVIGLGGGVGSLARYGIGQLWPAAPGGFPWATFTINITGCFLLGLLMVFVIDVWRPGRYLRPFAGVGLLGGYTTFSTFAVETRALAGDGEWLVANVYAVDSLLAGLAAVWLGVVLARLLAGIPVRLMPRHREGIRR
jgi:CrcB protein